MPVYRSSYSSSSDAIPSTPRSRDTSGIRLFRLPSTLVKGRKVARPARFLFKKEIIRFAVSSSSVTMFWILPPNAVSIAVSYFSGTWIRSATTPTSPGSDAFCSITRRTDARFSTPRSM